MLEIKMINLQSERIGLIQGRIQSHAKGFGFLIPEAEGETDVFIPSSSYEWSYEW